MQSFGREYVLDRLQKAATVIVPFRLKLLSCLVTLCSVSRRYVTVAVCQLQGLLVSQ